MFWNNILLGLLVKIVLYVQEEKNGWGDPFEGMMQLFVTPHKSWSRCAKNLLNICPRFLNK